MDWIYEKCECQSMLVNYFSYIEEEINRLVKKYLLFSLEKIVVCNNDHRTFMETVNRYNNGYESVNEKNIYGKVLEKNIDGKLVQTIIYKEDIVIALLFVKGILNIESILDKKSIYDKAIIFYHEFGHVFDNQKHYYVDKGYNWQGNVEGKEFLEREAYTFWGEYYAQSMAISEGQAYIKNIDSRLEELINEINNINQSGHSYVKGNNILYFFAHYCAFCDWYKQEINFAQLRSRVQNDKYVLYLERIKNILYKMKAVYPQKTNREDMLDLMESIEDLYVL